MKFEPLREGRIMEGVNPLISARGKGGLVPPAPTLNPSLAASMILMTSMDGLEG